MLYHMREIAHASLAPARAAADLTGRILRHPANPWRDLAPARWLAAGCEVFDNVTARYDKPEFDLHSTVIDGREVPVVEEVIQREPFCDLLHFRRLARRSDPRLLVVAPMSGHYATLLRDTVRALMPSHDVFVTDWLDAAMVPLADGGFDLDDYIDYVIDFIHTLGPDTHVLAVCQPAVPVLAAVSLMASRQDPLAPRSMTLIGGPIDTRRSPTVPNDLATTNPLSWFEKNLLATVPATYPGFGRRVYPGFLQLSGFISMNIQRHVDAHQEFFNHLVEGDGDSAEQHRAFYREYLAVMDTSAEFYLQTIRTVFQEHALPQGAMHHRGEKVDPGAIKHTALLTVEGGKDDISGLGQTEAAQDLCTGLSTARKLHYVQPEVGHYGTFSGRRWREQIVPVISEFIRNS
ncbi:MAG TPA: polyhydroxyalkanoate depolymerase [Gammaproteobacteria bacterium]|uniref:polyhydroxyalkanoate depolymerase n=1 Tax=Immundisolibacter sp. TaxID=1934948 RepID=UPI000E8A22F4|nr:polyhydroxyalkanoate depolymerase [Gammaproteobacteria bacterium]HCZ48107.1 polyhydroxyalkanoate depolymerase [Gammaproteobacteria bacterium]MCH77545.1 polyhydroxyalkanoate depolymerase [Gammaproteobacteria bacterium]